MAWHTWVADRKKELISRFLPPLWEVWEICVSQVLVAAASGSGVLVVQTLGLLRLAVSRSAVRRVASCSVKTINEWYSSEHMSLSAQNA